MPRPETLVLSPTWSYPRRLPLSPVHHIHAMDKSCHFYLETHLESVLLINTHCWDGGRDGRRAECVTHVWVPDRGRGLCAGTETTKGKTEFSSEGSLARINPKWAGGGGSGQGRRHCPASAWPLRQGVRGLPQTPQGATE